MFEAMLAIFVAAALVVVFALGFLCGRLAVPQSMHVSHYVDQSRKDLFQELPTDDSEQDEGDSWKRGTPSRN